MSRNLERVIGELHHGQNSVVSMRYSFFVPLGPNAVYYVLTMHLVLGKKIKGMAGGPAGGWRTLEG